MDSENENLITKEENRNQDLIHRNSCPKEVEIDLNSFRGSLKVVVKLMKSSNTACILLFAFFFMFCLISSDIWMPMVCKDIMDWGIVEINSVTLALGVGIALAMVLVFMKPPSPKNLVYIAMCCVACLICAQIIYAIFKVRGLFFLVRSF